MIVELAKLIGGFVISAGVGACVENAITATTPVVVNTLQRVFIRIGGVVITGMIAEKATDWVGDKIKQTLVKPKAEVVEVKPE